MTTRTGAQDPAVAEFTAALKEFHAACGAPTYRSLATTAQRLTRLYPELRTRNLPGLSVSAISEILGGRRAGPPQAAWVTVFVLSCQRRAWEEGFLDCDPGTETAHAWLQRLQQVLITRATQEHPPRQ